MKAAVVGGAGYIGSFTSHALRDAGWDVVIIDDLSSGHKEAVAGLRLEKIDVVKQERELAILFETEKFDAVFHFAALIQMEESMKDPALYFRHNIGGSINVLEAARTGGAKRFIFSSTAGVYGNPQKLPIPEEHPKNPTNPYGESKVMVERTLAWYFKIFGISSVSIRYFNAAGASLDGKTGEDHPKESHLMPRIIRSVLRNEEITVFGNDYETRDGTCIRDYVHVLDLATAHIKALEYLEGREGTFAFNTGTGQGHSNLEVIKMVEQVSGKKVQYSIGPRREGDAANLVADPTKAQKELGWKPRFSDLETIVKSAWAWHRKNPNGYSSV
ncbi:MAG: UDP-glucose 4-epimerase GalE [Candidatus Blackburnbacteria bacterium]|nr:UDP-glucose 4-epimerase GalE [Candidatus Blackburnbacteria bacterium]